MARSRGKRKKTSVSRIKPWLPLAGLAFIVLALFSRSLKGEFVYDSAAEIEQWGFIHDSANLLTALTFRVMSLDVIDFNRPVAVTSFMFDSVLWGMNPFGYHLTNILLHLGVTCCVFLTIRHILSLGKNSPVPEAWSAFSAFLGALVFAVHPAVTEAVCEPANRKDLLAVLFGLGAFLVIIRHRSDPTRGDVLRIFLCWLLCLLSIGSKELGVAFPVIFFLYWFLFRRGESPRFWACAIGGSALAVAAFLVTRFSLAHHPSEVFVHDPTYPGGTFLRAILIQPRIYVLYLVNLFWPYYLCADENGYSIRSIYLIPSLLLLAGVASALVWWSIRDRRAFFAVGILLTALLPVSNLVPIYHPMADRYLYLPLAGLVILLTLALQSRWITATPMSRATATVTLLSVILFLASLTWHREDVWSNRISLWQDTLEHNPSSFAANINLPEALLRAGRLQDAKSEYEAVLRTPYHVSPQPWFGYALVLHRLGDESHARAAARKAISIRPDLAIPDKPDPTFEYEPKLRREFGQILAPEPSP